MTEYSDTMKRRRTDSPTEGESTDVSKKSEELPPASPSPLQTPSISSSIMAQSGGTAISPTLAGNTFHGPVCFKYYTGSAGATSAQSENVHASASSDANTDENMIKGISKQIKNKLRRKSELLFEGTGEEETRQHLNDVYTELYITDGVNEEVKTQHEFQQIRAKSRGTTATQAAIKCNDIFKRSIPVRSVMTKGIAGIGKSVTVQKFILDWREGKANEDVDFIFLLPFCELNLFINEQLSLLELLCKYHPVLREKEELFDKAKIIFICDGLDESKFHLNFNGFESLENITDKSSVDVLIVNLLNENLLPSASIWVTTRPAAAHQIPVEYIDRWTEIHGFSDHQKEQYFRNKIKDHTEADMVLKQIKDSRSLYIMCDIPVFCWILATVVLRMGTVDKQEIPQSLTELFSQFLLIQITRKEQKEVHEHKDPVQVLKSNKDLILKLSELAYRELENGNTLFSEDDLKQYSIDKDKDLEKSGMCTEFFVSETGVFKKKVFRFVHLSIQEFLAALFVFYSFSSGNVEALKSFVMEGQQLHDLLESAVKKSLQCQNGHLDLFLRFLLGLSLKSNQKLFDGLLTPAQENSGCVTRTVQFIKNIINRHNQSTERCMNLLLCLLELKDRSLHEEVRRYVESGELLSPAICSILAYIRLVSEDTQDVFDLTEYNTTDKGRMRLVIAVRSCRKARLVHSGLTKDSCEIISAALQSEGTQLTEVDLSFNAVGDSGVKVLVNGLTDRNSRLDTLRLASCSLTGSSCELLAEAIKHASSHLTELDLINNSLADSGVKDLCLALSHQNCKLKTLRLAQCSLTGGCCEELASALRLPHSTISELDLSNNDLGDSGVRKLCDALADPHCRLERLKLSGCLISERGCGFLSSALRQSPSHLRELDLSYNYPGDTASLEDNKCHLENLKVDHNDSRWLKPGLKKYACKLTLDENTAHLEVRLSDGNQTLTRVDEEQPYLDHQERFDHCTQVLCTEGLEERHYWEAEWSGKEAVIGVAYRSIRRKMWGADCKIGLDNKSCGLWCEGDRYAVRHNKNKTVIPPPASSSTHSRKVGVYLDKPAGTLSFYSISSGKLVHLHTFYSKFTEPLYPGFWVHVDTSVSLCQVT